MEKTVLLGLLIIVLAFGFIGCDESIENSETVKFTVTFDLDGGNIGGISSQIIIPVDSGKSVDNLPVPQKNNYTFGGWFSQKNGLGVEFNGTTKLNENMIVYAKWTTDPHYVYYGTWVYSESQLTFVLSNNSITLQFFDGSSYKASNLNWAQVTNNNPSTSTNYPIGYKLTGIVSEHSGNSALKTGDAFGDWDGALYIHKDINNSMMEQGVDNGAYWTSAINRLLF